LPIIEYECRRCGQVFEELILPLSDSENPTCPDCGCRKASRLFSVFGLRGSGGSSSSSCTGCSSNDCGSCG
jgi:putative FmdB family regulatory protein